MNAPGTHLQNELDPSGANWAADVVSDLSQNVSMTIGLTRGSRHTSDSQVVDALSQLLDRALKDHREVVRPMLVVRLQASAGTDLGRAAERAEAVPSLVRSSLGTWSEVSIPVPVGKHASRSLENLPHWLSVWKRNFGLILVDLGPISQVPSRVIGPLCDGCYIVLGPEPCGSRDWILRHVAWHQHSGSTIYGTLVANAA